MTGLSTIWAGDSALRWCKVFLLSGLLAIGGQASADGLSQFSGVAPGEKLPAPWRVVAFPGGRKPVSHFSIAQLRGESVLKVETDKSYGSALHEMAPTVLAPGSKLRWRWRLDEPLLQTDLKKREGDDSAIKICALFDMGVEKLGVVERTTLRMARIQTSDPIPAATLCYVWDHALPVGTRLANVYSQRLRFLVVDSGEQKIGQWVTHEQDLAADFLQAFGHETDTMPPLIGIAVGADSDNTGGKSLAYVGDLLLQR